MAAKIGRWVAAISLCAVVGWLMWYVDRNEPDIVTIQEACGRKAYDELRESKVCESPRSARRLEMPPEHHEVVWLLEWACSRNFMRPRYQRCVNGRDPGALVEISRR